MSPTLPCGENVPVWFCLFFWEYLFPFVFGFGHLWLMVIDDLLLLAVASYLSFRVLKLFWKGE
jgi:hypothetical protein